MQDGTKKTIIWETNSEPPKSYIWVKSDGKAYEFINGAWTVSPNVIIVDEDKTYVELVELEVTANETYTAPTGKAYSKVTVTVE